MRITEALFSIGVLAVVWSVYRANRNPEIDFNVLDLLLENNRVSRKACLVMGAFSVSSWMVIRLTFDGKLTEGYFGAYMAAWVAPMIAGMFAAPPPPSTVTTVTATQTKTEQT